MHASGRESGLLGGHFGTVSDDVWGSRPSQSRGGFAPRPSRERLYWVCGGFFRLLTLRNLKKFRFQGLDFLFRSFLFVRRGVVHHRHAVIDGAPDLEGTTAVARAGASRHDESTTGSHPCALVRSLSGARILLNTPHRTNKKLRNKKSSP